MEKSIFEMITEYAVNEGVNAAIQQNDEYRQIQKKMNDLTSDFHEFNLPEEQRLIIDDLLDCYNESGAYYGKMTYQKGFRDCVLLLLEIGLIKDGKEEKVA